LDSPSIGSVVLLPFPFSDLSKAKVRPAVVLAFAGKGDWILCQVTSKPYADSMAVEIMDSDFEAGGLRVRSFARPAKLFTANGSIFFVQCRATWQIEKTISPTTGDIQTVPTNFKSP
jgi:mRNA interferase MazF